MRVLKMSEVGLRGKRVLIRVDFNVPIQDGKIVDDTRIRAAVPGIREALAQRARLMVVSHLGRPTEGEFSEKESLAPVARDRKSTRLNSSHITISYVVFCLKKKKQISLVRLLIHV